MKPKIALAAWLLAFAPLPALAHGITVWTEVKDGKVHVEVHYTDGEIAKKAAVRVTAGGKTVLEGKTDDKGSFDFAPPVRKELTVKATAGGHHTASATVKEEELKDVPLAPAPKAEGAK